MFTINSHVSYTCKKPVAKGGESKVALSGYYQWSTEGRRSLAKVEGFLPLASPLVAEGLCC